MIFKGYAVPFGYMGLVEGRFILFATENEYVEYIRDGEFATEDEYYEYLEDRDG